MFAQPTTQTYLLVLKDTTQVDNIYHTNMEEGIDIRINKLLGLKGMSKVQFSRKTGISPAAVHSIASGRAKPSFDVVSKIVETFPEVNAEWLLTGKGSMLKENRALPPVLGPEPTNQTNYIDEGHRAAERIRHLEQENRHLKADYEAAILSLERMRKLNLLLGLGDPPSQP